MAPQKSGERKARRAASRGRRASEGSGMGVVDWLGIPMIVCAACAAVPKPKCRRCYRLRWDAAHKEHNATLRRARHLRTRAHGLAMRREHYLKHREQSLA